MSTEPSVKELIAWALSMIDGKNPECPYKTLSAALTRLSARVAELEEALDQIVFDIDTIEDWTDRQILEAVRKLAVAAWKPESPAEEK